jgi:hypothetical protein
VDMLCSRSLQFNNADIGRQHRGVLAEDFERTRVIFRGKEGLLAHFAATFQCGSINCRSGPAVLAANPLLCRLVPRHWPHNVSSKKFSASILRKRIRWISRINKAGATSGQKAFDFTNRFGDYAVRLTPDDFFGLVASSVVIFDTASECFALLVGLRGRLRRLRWGARWNGRANRCPSCG